MIVNPRAHLSAAPSIMAEELLDPGSDSPSGKPQSCLFLKAARSRTRPALFSCGSLYIPLSFFFSFPL